MHRRGRAELDAETRGERHHEPGEPQYDFDTYEVTYRTRPGGPVGKMRIKAESSFAAEKMALYKGVDSVESVKMVEEGKQL